MSFEQKINRWLKPVPMKHGSRSRARGDRAGGSFANDEMIVKHTKPQTAVDDGPHACTSTPPTLPGLAGQRSYADAWCIPSARPRQTGRSIRTAAPVPFPGPVHLAPQDPSSSVNSGASVRRSQAPSASRSAQGSAPATTAPNPVPYRQLQTPRAVRHRLRGIHLAPLPLTIRPQPRDAFLDFFHPRRFEEIFHAERPPPVNHSQSRFRPLPAGDGPNDEKGLFSRCDGVGKRGIRRLKGIVFLAGEEAQERTALLRDVVADGAAQHRILCFECIEDGALRDGTFDVELHLRTDARQRPQMSGEYDANHGSVWTSTESTAGRCCTMGVQESPALAEAYTWPPVVPKYTPHLSSESTAMASRKTFT